MATRNNNYLDVAIEIKPLASYVSVRKKFEIKIFVVVVIVYISVSLEMCNFFRIRFLFGFRFQSRLFFSKLSCYVSENCEKSSMRVMKPEEATRLSG